MYKCINCEKANISISAEESKRCHLWIGYTYCPECRVVYTVCKYFKRKSEAKAKAERNLKILLDLIDNDKTKLVGILVPEDLEEL